MNWPSTLLKGFGLMIVAPLGVYLWTRPSEKVIKDIAKLRGRISSRGQTKTRE